MLKFIENIYEVKVKRKNVCYIKNNIMYGKWPFPTSKADFNPTYTEKISKTILKEILTETQNYKTILATPLANLDKKYPEDLDLAEKTIIYGLEKKSVFPTNGTLTYKTVKTKEDLVLWGQIASQVYKNYDTDFIYESFKTDIGKKYATYFIFYKGNKAIGTSQIIRGAGYSAVYWVAVLEKYRRQGYGTELTKLSLNHEIMHHHNKFILSASELGLIMYKKLGFKPIETFYEYNLKKHL